jgi:CBS domain-containing protein
MAACRLETLGFEHVYDYVDGKVDWLAHQRPIEGERADEANVGEFARNDVVTCTLRDRVGRVRELVAESPCPFALVKSADGVLLGRLRQSMLDCDPGLAAEDVMEPGPWTVRPHKSPERILHVLVARDLRWAIVTTPDGELVGVAARAKLEAAVAPAA